MPSEKKPLGGGFIFKRISPEEIERVILAVNANESHLKISSLLSMYEFPTESPDCPKGRTGQQVRQTPNQLAASVKSEPTVPAMIGGNHNEHREESKGAIKEQLGYMGGEVPLDDLSAQQLAQANQIEWN